MKAWVLVGMMGAGKTSIGRKLSVATGREFVDTDILIQNRLGRSIEKIFEYYGEQAFRDHETRAILELAEGSYIVSTGGGAVMRHENWDHLQKIGQTIYLKASPETLIERLKESKKKRPLLDRPDWESRIYELLAEREATYRQADIVVHLDTIEFENACEAVLEALQSQ
jgi:shikimate kinase